MKLAKRKRVNSEVSQQSLGLGDDENHQAVLVTVPTWRERPVPLGSLADCSPSSLSVKCTHKRQKTQVCFSLLPSPGGSHIIPFIQSQQKTYSSRQFQGSDPSDPSNR